MKMDQMTIAQIQHRMSKVLAKQNLRPWSVDDEIMTAQFNPLPAPKSRNQREGYYWGKEDGKSGVRTPKHPKRLFSCSTYHSNRKDRKLYFIRRKKTMANMKKYS